MAPPADARSRLVGCFQAVFPGLSADEAQRARPEAIPGWDSIATVTLLNVVEEEFGVVFAPEDLERLTSFDTLLERLAKEVA
jgi:acyl carrier protein